MSGRAIAVVMATLLLVCIVGSAWTAYWMIRFGLAPRGPVTSGDIAVRLAIALVALAALVARRDPIERFALAATILAAASTVLVGIGLDVPATRAARLLLHLLAYSFGAFALLRWFRSPPAGQSRTPEA